MRSNQLPSIGFLVFAVSLAAIALPQAFAQHDQHVESSFHASKEVAGFHVELTVEPVPIEPGKLTRFGTVFRDVTTGEPASDVPHTFILLKGEQVVFRESTSSAHYMHEFMFVEEHKGPLTVRIEDVNASGENVEFSLTVVPEFPVSAIFVMSAVLVTMLALTRFRDSRPIR